MTVKKIEKALSSPLFLAIAILETVAFAMGCAINDFNIISLLLCIGVWIVYGVSKSGKLSEKQSGIKMISGTVKASYIITWVCIGFIVVGAVILMAAGPRAMSLADRYIAEEEDSIAEFFDDAVKTEEFDAFASVFDEFFDNGQISLSGLSGEMIAETIREIVRVISDNAYVIFAVIGILMLFGAVIATLVNIFFTGNLHKLTKSACLSVANGSGEIKKIGTVKIWFLVLGILSAISALSSMIFPYVAIPAGCKGASYIIAYILLDRFEKEGEPQSVETTPEQL